MDDKRWMGMYERTEEYRRLHAHFEELALQLQLLYGTK
jgi:hypothetical protein